MDKQTNEKRIDRLNDLIRINNDRFEGYSHASKEIEDQELEDLFFGLAHKSKDYNYVLAKYVNDLSGIPEEGTTTSGKLYRIWMDIRAAFMSKDKRVILASCEYGEDAALKTYEAFIETNDLNMAPEMLDTIRIQKSELQMAHDKIKKLRDDLSVKI